MLIILITAVAYSGFYFVPSSAVSSANTTNVTLSSVESITTEGGVLDAGVSYNSTTFWMFVLLMSLGTINFNVGNCVSDAICFDVLGENQEMKYGNQRVWGTIGFGLTALIGGIAVDMTGNNSIGPALVVMLVFTLFDLLSVTKLKVRRHGHYSLAPEINPSIIHIIICFLAPQDEQ